METITFYSYKGGVGRTLALANVAIYLSRFGQNVCILDFDLEAPGLHHKFPQYLKKIKIKKGMVDYIYEFTHSKVIPKSLKDFSLEIIKSKKSQGEIRLIPAGNVISPNYWKKLASIDWHSLFYKKNSIGVPFFLELKEIIRKEFKPNFLLIDSRTGITEMSGICTSIFPDRVVFLVINNKENIEGARQILQSLQRSERFPEQKPIQVIFGLTRIPFPKDEEERELEKKIVDNIINTLNKPTKDLESQPNIEDICILHSDRELELSESLRMGQKELTEETPLSRDYLRLFSKIIPQEIIVPRLDEIIEKIVANVWEEPDSTQKELEGLVSSYIHPKSLEKLIEFYFVRNAEKDKLLKTFHKLWDISRDVKLRIFLKYISLFLKEERLSSYAIRKYNLEIIERYLDLNPENKLEVELKLANAYKSYDKPNLALKHYFRIINESKEIETILGNIFDIYIDEENYTKAMKLFKDYSDIIDVNVSLVIKKIEVMYKMHRVNELRKTLAESLVTQNQIMDENPLLYFGVMEAIGKEEEASRNLNRMLGIALSDDNTSMIFEIGRLFYKIGKVNEFKDLVSEKHPDGNRIIEELNRRLGRRYTQR